jgi:hypothetical protein
MMRDINAQELERAEIRAIQSLYPKAHDQCVNWGRWSRDRRGIFPSENPPPSAVYDIIRRDEWDKDGYGEQEAEPERLATDDRKAERAADEPYDELQGYEFDTRIHQARDFPAYLRSVLKAAYVTREVPEDQFHRHTNPPCNPAQFREWLAQALAWVER